MLRKVFPEKVDVQLLRTLLQRQKQEHESMMSYFYEKMALMLIIELKHEVMIDLLIDGIRDAPIRAGARAGKKHRLRGFVGVPPDISDRDRKYGNAVVVDN